MTVRFFLGVAESTITPSFMFLTSTWYTRDEMPTRVGIWFAGNSAGGLVSNVLAFGLGHIKGNIHPWRWMYIVLGAATFVWAFPMFFLLPNSISEARFLTQKERHIAAYRVVVEGTGSTKNSQWKLDQVKECLVDPKSWFIVLIVLLTQVSNGSTQNFSNIVIESFGFTNLQSTLINIPYSLISAAIVAGTGWLAGRYRTLNCILIVLVVMPSIAGSALIYHRNDIAQGVDLLAYFLLSAGPAALPLNMSLVQSNYRGVTKKMTMTAMLFLAYCVGNIAGPHLFRADEAPLYPTAFYAIMICWTLTVLLALCMRVYLQWTNQSRAKREGIQGNAETMGMAVGERVASALSEMDAAHATTIEADSRLEDHEDVTDWKALGFRYRF